MANAGAMQSAALRRLAAAMRQDEEQVLLAQQAAREEEREPTAAARSKAVAVGVDPQTTRVVKSVPPKFPLGCWTL